MAKNYDELLQGCENEQLHLSGAIQSFGGLIVVDYLSRVVTHASANIELFINCYANQIIGKTLCDIELDWIDKSIYNMQNKNGANLFLNHKIENYTLYANCYFNNNSVVIELEKYERQIIDFNKIATLNKQTHTTPHTTQEFNDYCNNLVKAIHEITGFERVMLYKFLDDWSGEVVAEYRDDNIGSYLGLRFPASDIPAIARNIYMLNPSRFICDVNLKTVNIISRSNTPPDLTYSELRSVSPVHLEYLSNMGINCSFSLSVVSIGKLVGLVACHSTKPLYISPDIRKHCVSIVKSFALGTSLYKTNKRLELLDSLDRKLDNIASLITKTSDFCNAIKANDKLIYDLFCATGIAVCIEDKIMFLGQTPTKDDFDKIDSYFLNNIKDNIFLTDSISSILDVSSQTVKDASGVLAIGRAKNKNLRFYCFRVELPIEINWAGNPDKPVSEDVNATHLAPRKSFERYVQITHGYSREWHNEEKSIALKFLNLILK